MAIISGWHTKYSEIVKDFGYSPKSDLDSARLLNSLLKNPYHPNDLEKIIQDQLVFVVGAGPSLTSSIPFLKKYKKITMIAADGATKALIDNQIKPDIVVTDLDGDIKSLKKVGMTNSVIVVHAHGDNPHKLKLVTRFKNCIGTTQGKTFGNIHNFGGFTDGDRCVFLAAHFKAKIIIMFGMDFGTKIGKYSKLNVTNRKTKLKKLQWGKKLLEWFSTKKKLRLYTTSNPIKGFKKIHYKDLEDIMIS